MDRKTEDQGAAAGLAPADHLTRFYRELQAWIDGGCGPHQVFAVYRSVCGAALEWQRVNLPEVQGLWTLWNAIASEFAAFGLHEKHPFNEGDFKKWEYEMDSGRAYTNPSRLAWIKAHAEAPALQPEASRG